MLCSSFGSILKRWDVFQEVGGQLKFTFTKNASVTFGSICETYLDTFKDQISEVVKHTITFKTVYFE